MLCDFMLFLALCVYIHMHMCVHTCTGGDLDGHAIVCIPPYSVRVFFDVEQANLAQLFTFLVFAAR